MPGRSAVFGPRLQIENAVTSKPSPLYEQPARKRCPICGEISYSAEGVHPQCRVAEADSRRMEKLKAARKAEEDQPVAVTSTLAHWQRKFRSAVPWFMFARGPVIVAII